MAKRYAHLNVLLPIIFLFSLSLQAQNNDWNFDYPELMVTPLASDRLQMEANNESRYQMGLHLPMQISSLTTLLAGILQTGGVDEGKDPDKHSALSGIIVGSGFLAASFYFNIYHKPYTQGLSKIKSINGNSKKDRLTRERLAEEALQGAASTAKKLIWASAVFNLASNIYIKSNAEKNSSSDIASLAGIIAATAPIIFGQEWIRVNNEQIKYKKKIYGPISMNGILYEPSHRKWTPGFSMAFTF